MSDNANVWRTVAVSGGARLGFRTCAVQGERNARARGGDRDPLCPVELALTLYRSIPASALAVLPNAGHGPIFADHAARFAQLALEFLAADV